MKRELYFLAVLGLALPIVGCGGSGDDDINTPPAGAPFIAFRNNQLVRGEVNNPLDATSEAISGIPDGVDIIGLDDRPKGNGLYALGSDNRIYAIDLGASSATPVSDTPFGTVTGTAVGFDFNPFADRIRIIGNDGQSLRVNPDTGALSATDTTISDPNAEIVAAAYTNNVSTPNTQPTTLYAIDAAANTLVRVGGVNGTPSPNGGVVTTIGTFAFDVTDDASFDITASGEAYLVNGTTIYLVNLANANVTPLGQFDAPYDAFTIVP